MEGAMNEVEKFSFMETEEALQRMKRNRAVGVDEVTDMIDAAGEMRMHWLYSYGNSLERRKNSQ